MLDHQGLRILQANLRAKDETPGSKWYAPSGREIAIAGQFTDLAAIVIALPG